MAQERLRPLPELVVVFAPDDIAAHTDDLLHAPSYARHPEHERPRFAFGERALELPQLACTPDEHLPHASSHPASIERLVGKDRYSRDQR